MVLVPSPAGTSSDCSVTSSFDAESEPDAAASEPDSEVFEVEQAARPKAMVPAAATATIRPMGRMCFSFRGGQEDVCLLEGVNQTSM